MNIVKIAVFVFTSALSLGTVHAHGGEEEPAINEAPNCEALKEMDSAGMGMDDPVMQAMMQQCENDSEGTESHDDDHGGHH